MGLHDFSFYDLINRNAAAFKEFPAWYEVDEDKQLTFNEIKTQVDRLAGGLNAAGVKKGDRLGVIGLNSIEFFLLYGAAAALGAVMLPVNWRLSADELCYNLKDGAPEMLFADADFQATINERRQDLPSVKKFYNLKGDKGDFQAFASLLESGTIPQPHEVNNDDGFVIIHTAAVSGQPRGALVSHGNILCAGLHIDYYFALSPKDVHLNLLPLFHVAGLFMAISAFQAGAMNVNLSRFDAARAAELIETYRASLFFDFPPILSGILSAAEEKKTDLSSLRAVIGLGTPEDIGKYQEMSGGSYYCMYGQTETSMLATIGRYNDAPGSAGRPIILADVRTVDEHDNPRPAGEAGEIVMKGPMVFQGYWNQPELNARTFRNGWHHTGDMGRFDSAGWMFYAGRMAEKELIKPGGENVYPEEVEVVIRQHPSVEKTVVFGVPDPKWKEGIKAVCLLKPGTFLEADELISFVGERIARYKKPHYVEVVTELPLKTDGTPDREKIKALYGTS